MFVFDHAGESIPQMKEALTEGVTEAAAATAAAVVEEGIEPALEDEAAAASEHARTDAEVEATVLDINSLHRVNTLFSGTMQHRHTPHEASSVCEYYLTFIH